jgi:sodium transport system permease protein
MASSPRETLLLKWPRFAAIPAAALLAVVLHPTAMLLQSWVQQLYPVGENLRPALAKMHHLFQDGDLGTLIFVIALVPAVCEELAFRGFILSGLRHLGHKWQAIVFSALLFGLTHGILQQSLIACLLGIVLAWIAIQSRSILPGMIFHIVHNSLAVVNGRVTPEMIPESRWLRQLITPVDGGGFLFEWPLIFIGFFIAVLLLAWFGRLTYVPSQEEKLTESIECGESADAPCDSEKDDESACELASHR